MKNTRRQALPILACLNALNKKYGKLYCYPSQLKIIENLSLYQGIDIAIATVNRWLGDVQGTGYLIRTRRIRQDPKLGTVFQSTLYKITLKGYRALKDAGVSVWRDIEKITVAGIKAAERALSKFSGPVALKTVFAATTMFKLEEKTWIVEK